MDEHQIVGDVRGKGLMICLELVADRATKSAATKSVMGDVFEKTYSAGVMVRVSSNNVILSPPLVITSDDVATIIAGLNHGLSAVG